MGTEALIRKTVAVEFDGRYHVCSPPTFATVLRATSLFGSEIATASDSDIEAEILRVAAIDPDRTAGVLATCVSPAPSPESPVMMLCAEAVLTICDSRRIVDSLAADMEYGSGGGDDAEDHNSLRVVQLARVLGISPLVLVNDWPYEAILEVQDALRIESGGPSHGPMDAERFIAMWGSGAMIPHPADRPN